MFIFWKGQKKKQNKTNLLKVQIWVIGTTMGCNHYLIFIVINGYLSWHWSFWMNLYNNIPNVLWEHVVKFEMNPSSI